MQRENRGNLAPESVPTQNLLSVTYLQLCELHSSTSGPIRLRGSPAPRQTAVTAASIPEARQQGERKAKASPCGRPTHLRCRQHDVVLVRSLRHGPRGGGADKAATLQPCCGHHQRGKAGPLALSPGHRPPATALSAHWSSLPSYDACGQRTNPATPPMLPPTTWVSRSWHVDGATLPQVWAGGSLIDTA